MPATIEKLTSEQLEARVKALGAQVRQRRKALGISVITAAEAAGMSRDTWHRMEKGEVTVTIAAWFNALAVLGLEFGVGLTDSTVTRLPIDTIPVTVALADFPQLAALAWQVQGATEVSPREAFDIYERNKRHLDRTKLTPEEKALIASLNKVFGGSANV
ncbi:MAG: helix-turn-helix domain-containing protein [Halieaceae bacterium]|nr:helix-turn-helix domain-containing protein [Halieaceae bacterium]MCP5147040.1 helix-turn-helix domain-containing protein [Pseudomonadales bacterium]MCP5188037.1 helix-turn-helix domain-containing protein [Pseudomonadales bacterium]